MDARVTAVTLAVLLVGAACAPADEGGDSAATLRAATEPAGDDDGPVDAPADATSGTTATDDVDGDLEVHYIDVGQADATLVLHDDAAILIDQGDWQRNDVVPYLQQAGVERLDVVATTHPHADHVGQFGQVLDAFDVDEVWWSPAETTTQTYERALDALEQSDVAFSEPQAGQQANVGPLTVDIVGPDDQADLTDLHDANLSLRITYGQTRFLFTGDAEHQTEQRMVERHADLLAADVLQLGHHGSETSTTGPFLETVAPTIAIYSAGSGNSYGHPHRSVLDRVTAAGISLYGTDVHGTVVVTSDGADVVATTARDGAPTPGSSGDGGHDHEPADDDATDTTVADGCVDLNDADPDQLQTIIHIGEDRADAIVNARPFDRVEQLTRLDGIGDGRLTDILDQQVACVR